MYFSKGKQKLPDNELNVKLIDNTTQESQSHVSRSKETGTTPSESSSTSSGSKMSIPTMPIHAGETETNFCPIIEATSSGHQAAYSQSSSKDPVSNDSLNSSKINVTAEVAPTLTETVTTLPVPTIKAIGPLYNKTKPQSTASLDSQPGGQRLLVRPMAKTNRKSMKCYGAVSTESSSELTASKAGLNDQLQVITSTKVQGEQPQTETNSLPSLDITSEPVREIKKQTATCDVSDTTQMPIRTFSSIINSHRRRRQLSSERSMHTSGITIIENPTYDDTKLEIDHKGAVLQATNEDADTSGAEPIIESATEESANETKL